MSYMSEIYFSEKMGHVRYDEKIELPLGTDELAEFFSGISLAEIIRQCFTSVSPELGKLLARKLEDDRSKFLQSISIANEYKIHVEDVDPFPSEARWEIIELVEKKYPGAIVLMNWRGYWDDEANRTLFDSVIVAEKR
jgi:hypothetical protein